MRRSIERLKVFAEIIILAVLLGIWANITVDKVSRWMDDDETAGMAEKFTQEVPFK